MSAQHIYDHAPLGSLIKYADGAPKPPARFTRKLRDWESRNGVGRLWHAIGRRWSRSMPAATCWNESKSKVRRS